MTGPQPPYGDQGGQAPGGGGDWQAPSDETQYSAPTTGGSPSGYDQPQAYDQPGFEQPQQYDQYGQPGYADPYSAPPAGYAGPGYGDPNAGGMVPPPASSGSSNILPWVFGGVAALVLLLLVGIGAVVLMSDSSSNSSRGGGSGPGSTTASSSAPDGKYTGENVSNACDLIDPKVLEKWADKEEEEPEHREDRGDYISSFSCSARYEGEDYSSASIRLYATLMGDESSSSAKDYYDRSEKSAKGETGSGRETGDVSGVGEDAYFSSEEKKDSYSSSVIYEIGVLDGNLFFTIHIMAFVGKDGETVSKDDVADVAKEQAKKVLEGME